MGGPFPNVVFAKARKRPAKMCGTPEKRRDDPARSKGQFPCISAGLIHFLGCSEKNKWCQKRDRDVSPKRYITMLYCDFSNFDTVENTVLALALVLNEDSNRCGRSISDQSATPKFILRPADNFLPENGEKPNQAAPNEAAMAGAISAASCCTTAPLPTNRSTLAIRRRSSPSIMP